MNLPSQGGGGNRIRSSDWRDRAEIIRKQQLEREPVSIVVCRLIVEYFADVTIQRFNGSREHALR